MRNKLYPVIATVVYAKNRNHYTQHVPTSVFKIYKLNWIIFLFSGIITLWCHFLNSFFKHLVCIFTKHYLCLRLWVTDRTFQNLWWNILLKESRVYEWLPGMLYKCTHGSNLKVCGWNPEVWPPKSVLSELSANRWVTDLRVARAMHDFQEQCQTVFHEMVCLSLFLQILV